jgi:hypothetical protein
MGLLLRADAEFVPTAEGLWIVTNHGAQRIHDPALYRQIDHVRTLLTGDLDRAGILAAAPEAERVLAALAGARALRDGTPGAAADSAEAAFVGSFVGDAATRVTAFRTARYLLAGTGPLAGAVADACRVAGLTSVTAVADIAGGEEADLLIDVTGRDTLTWAAPGRPALVARAALRLGQAWLAPVCPAADTVPWSKVWAGTASPDGGQGTAAVLRVVAAQLVQRVLRRVTAAHHGAPPATFRRIDLDGLAATEHRHPGDGLRRPGAADD